MSLEDLGNPYHYQDIIRSAVSSMGEQGADIVLNFLMEKIRSGKFADFYHTPDHLVYHLLEEVKRHVRPEHSQMLGEILMTDEVAKDSDRSNKSRLVSLLGGIGNAEAIPYLIKYMKRVKDCLADHSKSEARAALNRIVNREISG